MAKRDPAEYLAAAEDTLAAEPLPENAPETNDEPVSLADYLAEPDGDDSAAADANEWAGPLATADIKYILRLIGDFLPGTEVQTVRVFGRRCVALKGESDGILVVTSIADMRTLLRTVAGAY